MLMFLYDCGKISTPERHEFILLSDVLGFSALVDMINTRGGATEGSNLGPFYLDDAPRKALGAGPLGRARGGDACWCTARSPTRCTTRCPAQSSTPGRPTRAGTYPIQEQAQGQDKMDLRGMFEADDQGRYWYTTVLPKPYTVPYDGPVGRLLRAGNRHAWRPAHLHYIVRAPGMAAITTEVFFENTEYIDNDAVFGVPQVADRQGPARRKARPSWACRRTRRPTRWSTFDFVLAPAGLSGMAAPSRTRPAEFVEALAKGLAHPRGFDAAHPR